MPNHVKEERGFIALMSAVIISAVLMLVVASAGLISINSRSNTLDSELKERSVAAADACADQALYSIAQNSSYTGGVMTLNTLDQCRIGKITTVGSNVQFEVQATSSKNSVTNLQIVANSSDFSVVSWQEITTY